MTATEAFRSLAPQAPFPWQTRLLQKWEAADFSDEVLRMETGTGKTSVISIWLAALASNPNHVPRRLVYIVNRRTVVDQTTSEIEKICNRLRGTKLDAVLRQMCTIALHDDESALAVSTLRGQLADNQTWSADPARAAVIVGTVDMIGSRLLFSGYGIGWRSHPLHAGFLGQDSLIIHDECHLEPAFQTLLESIRNHQKGSFRPAKIVALSATPRKGQGATFELNLDDYKNPILKGRLHAPKKLTLHHDLKSLPECMAKKALEFAESQRPILIFANSVEDAKKIETALDNELEGKSKSIRMLTGTMRGLERDKLVEDPVFTQFFPSGHSSRKTDPLLATTGWLFSPAEASEQVKQTAFLIATSAGEVGINLSAGHLICDLVTFERMAQRLGRLNRFGEFDDATVDVLCSSEMDDRLKATRQLLEQLNGNASPANLSNLDKDKREVASSPLPRMVPITDILIDALSLTTLRDLPSKPSSLEELLHGVLDKEKPRTTVAWREEVAEIKDELLGKYPPEDLLESFRLKPHETLNDRSDRVLKELKEIANRHQDQPVWLVDHKGKVQIKNLENLLGWKSLDFPFVILPPEVGGLSATGMLNGKILGSESPMDVSCAYGERLRIWDTNWPGSEWKLVQRIDLSREDEEEHRIWSWYERAWGGDGEGQQTSRTVFLDEHHTDVEALSNAMCDSLGLTPTIREAVKISASKHDSGKCRAKWQSCAGNSEARAVAKPLERSFSQPGFRHELASLIDLQSDPDFMKLTEEQREIAQHMIAAHHGRARPIFPAKELHDPETPPHLVKQLTQGIPLRFADLQTKFGHWGLAYLESILRAADYAASAGRKPNVAIND